MANIKFSQFTEKTTLGTVDFLVGYTGAENVQISPTNLLSTFVSGSGTAGQVAYFDPSNNLTGENEFFWDYTNNRLGIGTISPSKQLHVRGSAPWIRIEEDSASNKRLDLYVDPSTAIAYIGANQSAQQLRFQTGSADRLNITNAGNVGIGTANPVSKLDVIGGVTAQGTLVATGISQLGSGGANVYLTSSSAGNVGIGTSSPGNKLEVAGGGVRASYFTSIGGRSFKMDNVAFVGGYSDGSGANGANDLGSATNQWRDLYLSGDITSSAGGATFAGNVALTGDLKVTADAATEDIVAQWADSNGNNTATFRTTTPGQIFEIRSQNSGTLKFDSTSSTFTGDISTSGDIELTSANKYIYLRTGTNSGLWQEDNFSLRFGTNNIEALELDNSQNATFAGSIFLPDNRDVGWNGGYSAGKPTLAAVGTTMKMFPSGSVSGAQFTLTPTTATFAGKVSVGGGDTSTAQMALKGQQSLLSFIRGTSGDAQFFMSSDSSRLYFSHTDTQSTNLILTLNQDESATFAGNVAVTNILHIDSAATGSPYIDWRQDGTQKAYIQYADSGDSFELQSDNQFVVRTGGSTAALTINSSQNATFAGTITTTGNITANTGHVNIDSGYSFQWGDTHERIEQSDGKIEFFTNNTQQMTLSGNNLGIGTDSPSDKLTVDGNLSIFGNKIYNGSAANSAGVSFPSSTTRIDGYNGITFHSSTTTVGSQSERMRINSSGNVLFGTTGIPDGTSFYGSGFIPVSTDKVQLRMASSAVIAGSLLTFHNPNGAVGNITITGSSTAYNTSSDYRLKEDLQDFAGLDMVSKIPVYDFKWKVDDSRSYGVLAHELQEVVPNAVSGEKDAEEMQGVDYSKIVPLLVKSIQELKSEIEELKSK
jgi:hypothetical protein